MRRDRRAFKGLLSAGNDGSFGQCRQAENFCNFSKAPFLRVVFSHCYGQKNIFICERTLLVKKNDTFKHDLCKRKS